MAHNGNGEGDGEEIKGWLFRGQRILDEKPLTRGNRLLRNAGSSTTACMI